MILQFYNLQMPCTGPGHLILIHNSLQSKRSHAEIREVIPGTRDQAVGIDKQETKVRRQSLACHKLQISILEGGSYWLPELLCLLNCGISWRLKKGGELGFLWGILNSWLPDLNLRLWSGVQWYFNAGVCFRVQNSLKNYMWNWNSLGAGMS